MNLHLNLFTNTISEIQRSLESDLINHQDHKIIFVRIRALHSLRSDYQFQKEIALAISQHKIEVLQFIYQEIGIPADQQHLYIALRIGSLEALKLILKQDPLLIESRFHGYCTSLPEFPVLKSALGMAIEQNHEDCALHLLEKGACFKTAAFLHTSNLVYQIIDYKMIRLLKTLLASKMLILKPSDFHYAIEKSNVDMVCFFIANCVPLYSSFNGKSLFEADLLKKDLIIRSLLNNYPYIYDQLPERSESHKVLLVEPAF